jgi:hypothetical protein
MVDLVARPDDPAQERVRAWFSNLGSGPWLPLYATSHEEGWNFGVLSAIAPPSYRAQALSAPSWDLHHGTHGPGFVQSVDDAGKWVTTYLRISSDPVEPLVIEREFHGIRAAYRELSEEFRLYHNLVADGTGTRFLKFDDAGNEVLASEIKPDELTVLTSLVRQFQAARQLDLLLFIDSTVFYDPSLPTPSDAVQVDAEVNSGLYFGDVDGRPFSRFLATRILPPPSIEHAGIWPYEDAHERYPDFVIGTDNLGRPVRHSCDPDGLANYFGANPGEPNYLTPVHFRRDVLVRYFDRPHLYTVEDGYLRCAGLWGLRLDNDTQETVVVWLGDLGRDLPAAERDYWLAFNVPPSGGISETNFRRAILGQWADPKSSDLRFRRAHQELNEVWRQRFGWAIFRDPERCDQHLLEGVRRPLHDTDTEFEDLVRILTRLLVDSLDEAALSRDLPAGPKDEKGISKLERWLKQSGYPEVDQTISFLRALQSVRSKGTAHRKGSDYEKELSKAIGPVRKAEAGNYVLVEALQVILSLRAFAGPDQHPPERGHGVGSVVGEVAQDATADGVVGGSSTIHVGDGHQEGPVSEAPIDENSHEEE